MARVTSPDVLVEATQILKKEGWVQGSFQNYNGRCALGAVNGAGYNLNATDGVVDRAKARLERALPKSYSGVIAYNDYPGRTFNAILRLFQKARTIK